MVYNVDKGGEKMNVGKLLKDRREQLNLSQQEVANLVGVSKSIISRWENGEVRNMGIDKIKSLCKALSLDPLTLINNDITETPKTLGYSEYPYIPDAVAAGIPETIEGITELPQIPVADELLGKYAKNKNIIIMRVNGESMNRVIENGSIIGVLTGISPYDLQDGDLVVFNHEYEYSLKRFYNLGDKIVFRPDSTQLQFTDIVYNADDNIEIIGKVIMSNKNYS